MMSKALRILLVLSFLVGVAISGCSRKPEEVALGALLCLTGDLSSVGESSQAALQVAIDDANEYLSLANSRIRVKLIAEDTEADPTVALEKLKVLAGKGVRAVIGPQSSAEAEAVASYADENDILLVSQMSTAPSLAVAGDNLFRFVPDDAHQAEALAKLMWEDGVRVVVPVWRGDVWGEDLSAAARAAFEQLGGVTVDGVSYSPTVQDFSSAVESLGPRVDEAVVKYGPGSVAVHLMAFEEAVGIFTAAGDGDSILSKVRWYGSDATALEERLIGDASAARFAAKTGYPSPVFGEGATDRYASVSAQVKEATGQVPAAYAMAAYDALWVVTEAYLAAGTGDFPALKRAFVQAAESHQGVTGWTALNEAGDRRFGDYDFWAITESDGGFQWARVARYQAGPETGGRLTYETGPSGTPVVKVLVVHSYHESWGWDQDVQRGIVEGLGRKGYLEGRDYELRTFYMDTKVTYATPEAVIQRAEMAIDLIGQFGPDVVFVNDDNALKYVAVEYAERYPSSQLPFVFSGVNVDPTVYGAIGSLDVPGGPITGALERFPYYEAFSLGTRIVPSASRIVLLADSSPSSGFVVGAFQERYVDVVTDSPLEVIGPFQVDTFSEWKDKIAEYQAVADFIGIMTYHQLRDDAGDVVPSPQVVDWTVRNSALPEIGFLTFHAEDGFLAAAGVSGYETGIYVGVIGGEILNGGDPATIPICDPGVVETAFNLERQEMLGITIPAADLSKAADVFQSIGETRY